MSTALFTHQACLRHETGGGHPERSDRLRAVLAALDDPEFADLDRREAPMVELAKIERVHVPGYAERLLSDIPIAGLAMLDSDTVVSPGSGEAALRAAGAVVAAVDAVATGQVTNAFCAVRPPGHHAEPHRAMGFCLINNIAVGALHARDAHGLHRVAVVDFDVHHGNGTQAMFEEDPELLYLSTHQWPLYPGTGSRQERGAHGNILNVLLGPTAGGAEFRRAMERDLLPALDAFRPDLLMISAGFDAHADDPLANLALEDEDFEWATDRLVEAAGRLCGKRIVSALEGGYNLAALGRSVQAHVRALKRA